MAVTKPINKVIFGGETLIDLTADTIAASDVKKGATFHDKTGAIVTGTNTFDSDTSDATAAVAEILKDKTAYVRGAKVIGTMPNNGAVDLSITTKEQTVGIAPGYHDGSGKVHIDAAEQAKLIGKNIRQGVTVLGVIGEMSGSEGVKAQTKDVIPTKVGLTVTPDETFTHLSQVTVKPIPYVLSDNAAGGQTATIA